MMQVTIPSGRVHDGYCGNLITIELDWICPKCGGPRGEIFPTHSFDGSRRLVCDGWRNDCGHIDTYAAARQEFLERRRDKK